MIRAGETCPTNSTDRARTERRALTRCPTCGARRSDAETCRRCGSDLAWLSRIEERAAGLFARALGRYARGRFRSAAALAGRSARLLADPRTLRLEACALLHAGDYAGARRAARTAREAEGR